MLVMVLLGLFVPIVYGANLQGTLYNQALNVRGNVLVEVDTSPKQTFVSKNGKYRFSLPLGNYTIEATYYGSDGTLHAERTVAITEHDDYVVDLILFPANQNETIQPDEPINETGTKSSIGPFQVIQDYRGIILGTLVFLILLAMLLIFYFLKNKKKEKPASDEKSQVIASEEPDESDYEYTGITVGEQTTDIEFDEGEENQEENQEELPQKVDETAGKQTQDQVKPEEKQVQKLGDEDLEKVLKVIRSHGGRTTQKEIRKEIPLSEGKISLIITELEHMKIIKKIKKGRGNIIVLK